ncbi:MAG: ABC transporter substrate-binding protein [Chloroflexi bacterium]|nr:ABC transporter substrate-binding protein [Chloroflexota bacterium]
MWKSMPSLARVVLGLVLTSVLAFAACAAPAAPPTSTPQAKSAEPAKKTDATPASAKPSQSPTPQAKVEKIRLGFSSTDMTPAPLWIAKEKGFLLKNGLDAELMFIEGGTKAVQTLISGEVPIVTAGGSGVIEGITSGAEIMIIASLGSAFPYKVVTAPNIKKPEDLKGKRLGVSKFGSASDFSLRQALKIMKLDPEKDVQILQIGGDSTRTAALQGGSIDGTVLNPPGTTIVLKAGFNMLLDMATLTDLDYQHTTIATSKAFIKNNPDIIQRFMKAIVEGIQFEKTNKEETKKIVQKYTKFDDLDGLEEAYMQYNAPESRLLFPAPYATKKGLQLVIDEVLASKKDAKKVGVDDVVDDRFVKELDQSGYIKSLYEKK